jgi:hypothetical protein
MENKMNIKAIFFLLACSFGGVSFGQIKYDFKSRADRTISPSYRISEKPEIIDTVVPIPSISYPLLSRNMRTEISIEQIDAAKIRIVEPLEKLYPGYVKLGIGNYNNPLGELYYNAMRNRRSSCGVHLKHNSAFRGIKGYAPSTFDNTTGHLFGEFFTARYKFETDLNYLNNGYHFYGIQDTLDLLPKDTLRNRVQGIEGAFKFSNFSQKDSAKVLYTIFTSYGHFHEFDPDKRDRNGKSSTFEIGTNLAYKLKMNVFAADFSVRYNKYRYAYENPEVPLANRVDRNNSIIHLKPYISTYGDKWKVVYGVDLNIDINNITSGDAFKVIPIIEGKYSLFNNMIIPYVGIGGGLKQNTFRTLNRNNEFILSSISLKNTREVKVYAGIKGTLSKKLSFNLQAYSTTFTDMALFINDTIVSDFYRFNVVYDKVTALGISGSISYQAAEKLKIDGIVTYNNYDATTQLYAWNLPALDIKLRGSYNLYDKIYVKTDLTLMAGRKSPEGLFIAEPTDEDFNLGFLADANLHMEYRYSNRFSVFLHFNNLAAQKYARWNRYPVQGFQVLGGLTFAF